MSSDGVQYSLLRSVLALQSGLLSDVISSVPCCNTSAVSLPFNSAVVKNLLAIVSCGISLPLSRDDLLNVKVLADILDIKLGHLEVEKTELKVPKKPRAKKKLKREDAVPSSPKPYLQNDNDNDSDEIVEITPEIFQGESEDVGSLPPHFLMQVSSDTLNILGFIFSLSDGIPGGLRLCPLQSPLLSLEQRARAH